MRLCFEAVHRPVTNGIRSWMIHLEVHPAICSHSLNILVYISQYPTPMSTHKMYTRGKAAQQIIQQDSVEEQMEAEETVITASLEKDRQDYWIEPPRRRHL